MYESLQPASRIPYNFGFTSASRNKFLAALPSDRQMFLRPALETVYLAADRPLHELGGNTNTVYFPESAVVALTLGANGADPVQVATIGSEGIIEGPLLAGTADHGATAYIQIGGQALRMDADAFTSALKTYPELAAMVQNYERFVIGELLRARACERLHSLDQRLCVALLIACDRLDAEVLPITHSILGQSLGVRRPSVTVAAGRLQKAGLIRYRHGLIWVADRAALEATACECYDVFRMTMLACYGSTPDNFGAARTPAVLMDA